MATKADIIRFLVMARDTTSTLVVTPAGKVVAAEPARLNTTSMLAALIAARQDLRGCVIYTYSHPHLTDACTAKDFGTKEIYFAAESDYIWGGEFNVQGVNIENLINNTCITVPTPGTRIVSAKDRG